MASERRTTEPDTRLTRLCAAMTEALEAHAEYGPDVQCAVYLTGDDGGGLVLHGYDDDRDAIADLFGHLRAIFRANGKDLAFVPVGRG